MNRESFPGGVYPLIGDVVSQAGNSTVQVVGLLGVPITSTFLNGGEVLEYNPNTNNWEPILRADIQVNSLTASDDPLISVNVIKPILVNGA